MAYLPKAARRAALLKAAVAVMERDGLSQLTTRAVAAEAGAANGILHHHFSSAAALKCEAFALFAEREISGIVQRIAAHPPLAALAVLLDDLIPRTGEEPHWRVWREAWDEAQTDRTFARTYFAAIASLHACLESALVAAADDPEFDADAASWRLLALSDGLIGLALLGEGNGPMTFAGAAANLRAAAEREIGRALGDAAAAVVRPEPADNRTGEPE